MAWQKNIADWLTDALRLIARAGLLIDAILLSAFSTWFVAKSCWKLMDLLDPFFE